MTRCKSCSAPLLANINLCRYCGIRNDVDLHGKHSYKIHSSQSKRICPECNDPLQTIDLDLNGPFLIERCEKCFGLFFDPGEIETLLQSSVSGVFQINRKMLQNINKDRYQNHKKVKYVQCPVCQNLMNRVNFGHRSGVIIDQCKKHGIWLDNGEITHLMEWKKAGGQILHKQTSAKPAKKTKRPAPTIDSDFSLGRDYRPHYEYDVVETVFSLVSRLFN